MPPQVQPIDDQLSRFERDGLVKFDQLLSEERVASARNAVLGPLEALGLWRDGAWRLDDSATPRWPATGLKPSRDIGNRHPELEALIEEPGVKLIVARLLGGRAIDRSIYRRPQVLASLPNAGPWGLPCGWHTDVPRLASGRSPGVQLFSFLEPAEPRGGATLAVAGSHRLLNDGRNLKVKEVISALRQEPFFRQLFHPPRTGPAAEVLPAGRAGEVPVRVVELVGRPGDAWLMDLRVLHAAAPNASHRPRLMITHRFLRADLMGEIAAAFGWT